MVPVLKTLLLQSRKLSESGFSGFKNLQDLKHVSHPVNPGSDKAEPGWRGFPYGT